MALVKRGQHWFNTHPASVSSDACTLGELLKATQEMISAYGADARYCAEGTCSCDDGESRIEEEILTPATSEQIAWIKNEAEIQRAKKEESDRLDFIRKLCNFPDDKLQAILDGVAEIQALKGTDNGPKY